MADFRVCDCSRCPKIKEYVENDTWMRESSGILDVDIFNNLPSGTVLNTREVFEEPIGELGISDKPRGIMFSAGSRLYDAWGMKDHNEIEEEKKHRVIVCNNPVNVYVIFDKESLQLFTNKYGMTKDDAQGIDKGAWKINWDAVRRDGHYGIKILFRKASHIECKSLDNPWHCTWDVEALVIWDLRALGETVEIRDVVF